jgi:hypothetical protein
MAAINFDDRRATSYLPQPVATDPLATPPKTTVTTQPAPGTTPQPGPTTSTDPYANGGTTPITIPPGFSVKAGPAAGQNLPTGTPAAPNFGNLSDPSTWMSLVGNDAMLKQWVTQGLGTKGAATPGLVDYYVGKIKGQPGANATEQAGSAAYYLQKLQNDPNVTGKPAPPEGGANKFGYDDPSAQLYLEQLLKTLGVFNTPVNDPTMEALNSLALKRVTDLGGKPYSAADDAALITQYRDPLTQARDAAKQQESEALARRGFDPHSGLFQAEMNKVDKAYEGGIAAGSNQLGVNAVKQKQANADEQLSILTNLLGVHHGAQQTADERLLTANTIAKAFPDFDMSRLNGLLAASGGGDPSSSALSSLISLAGLNNNTKSINDQNDSAYAAAIAKFIYALPFGPK